jgi:hypothetical protein
MPKSSNIYQDPTLANYVREDDCHDGNDVVSLANTGAGTGIDLTISNEAPAYTLGVGAYSTAEAPPQRKITIAIPAGFVCASGSWAITYTLNTFPGNTNTVLYIYSTSLFVTGPNRTVLGTYTETPSLTGAMITRINAAAGGNIDTFFSLGVGPATCTVTSLVLTLVGTVCGQSVVLDLGASPAAVKGFGFLCGYNDVANLVVEYSTNFTSWTTYTYTAIAFSAGACTFGKAAVTRDGNAGLKTARYWRFSFKNTDASVCGSSRAAVYEVWVYDNSNVTIPEPSTGPRDGCAGYCSATGAFNLSGVWKRSNGSFYENRTLTLVIKVCEEPNIKAGPRNTTYNPPLSYCSDGHLSCIQTTTDCNGAYSFAAQANILGAAVLLGGYSLNAAFDRSVTDLCDVRSHRIIADAGVLYPCCPAGIPALSGSSVGGGSPLGGAGQGLNDASPQPADTCQADLCSYNCEPLAIPSETLPTTLSVDCGLQLSAAVWASFPLGYTPVANPLHPGTFCQVANVLNGTYTLNITDGGQAYVRAYIIKDGSVWYVNGVNMTVTDGCAKTETVTTGGTTASCFCADGTTLQVLNTPGWAALSVVDWANITGVVINSGIPGGCSAGCRCGVAPGVGNCPPSLACGGPYGGPATDATVYPAVSGLSTLCVCQGTVVLGVHLPDCSTDNVGTKINADAYPPSGSLAVAWIGTDGALRGAVHNAPHAFIGQGGVGWEPTAVIEAANASDVGLVFQPNGCLYVTYDLSGVKKYRTNLKLGTGVAADWSASATPSPAVSRHSASGRGQALAFRFRALGNLGAGNVEFSYCGDQQGALWSAPVTAATGAYGPQTGGVWLNTGYGLLYTRSSDSHIFWIVATDPATWGLPGTDTGMTGIVVGLVEHASGALVGLKWDSGTKKCRAVRSRDRGATWEADAADIAAIPALSVPPAVAVLAHYAFAVWVTGDIPNFAASVDAGSTWV